MIPKTMKAAVVEKFSAPLSIREVPVPEPGPGEDALLQNLRPKAKRCILQKENKRPERPGIEEAEGG